MSGGRLPRIAAPRSRKLGIASALVVRARLDRRRYPIGKTISRKKFREMPIERDSFHGNWNYVIHPQSPVR